MDKEQLFEMLDIVTGEEFEYFENFADLAEYEGPIENDVIYELLSEVNLTTFAELCESYFYEILENIPGSQIDIYNLTENIKRVIIGLSEAAKGNDDTALVRLSDEFNKFRIWYSASSNVECRKISNGKITFESVRDAVALARLEKLDCDEYEYDFSDALDYELSEFIMTYGDLAAAEE